METQKPTQTPQPEQKGIYCQTCKHWSRNKPRFEGLPQPVFGCCGCGLLYQHGTYFEHKTYGNEVLYTDGDVEYNLDDLNTDMYTRQDFGCIYHEERCAG
ncbi:hypothetical protein CLV24_104173 [Pontibacter ummariensis]|uniref:Uncharacterized protein n=1 Tax=Pontibacter ummariensis TaxID=1610492 RepID=A0A239DCN0_9BACT|nr:hypothetical protein [Pontibacter ummariensis]PRY14363.1 hypothetical protein CLV24_104173 [Pontibacter ummariensis]SNS30176.1 hypothetical protein SAMN06296052_104172 [Pontibacter ummariensis]